MPWCICPAVSWCSSLPTSHLCDGGITARVRQREEGREVKVADCLQQSSGNLLPTPAISLGQVGDGARETLTAQHAQDKVGYIPLLHPWPNHVWITHHSMTFLNFWLSAERRRHNVIHQNCFRGYWWSWTCIYFLYFIFGLIASCFYLFIHLFVCLPVLLWQSH